MDTMKGNGTENSVYRYIKNKIIQKELFPGNQLVETQLVEETGLSRTPIREALKKLSYEGIVTIIPNRGAFVSSPSYQEIFSVYQCKKILESEAIRSACSHIKKDDISFLENLIREQTEAYKGHKLQEYLRLNEDFHIVIARASNNSVFEKFIRELTSISNVYLIFYDNFILTSASNSEALIGHREIVEALKAGDCRRAVEAMEQHNQTTLDGLNLHNFGALQ